MSQFQPVITAVIMVSLAAPTLAQDAPPPSDTRAEYSPYPEQDFPNAVYFGDTHLHTSFSANAGLVGATLGSDDAYRFARGEVVVSSSGVPARLERPLDFLVVTDHAENLGLPPAIAEANPDLLANDWGRRIYELSNLGTFEGKLEAYEDWQEALNSLNDPLREETALAKTMWTRVAESAEKYNTPGLFTALIGFEWTLQADGNNLHRNLIFRDGKAEADQIVPISQYDAQDPEELWKWMGDYEDLTGGRVLAIPHNGNLSNGLMFDDVTLSTKAPLDRDYAERRMRWEPLYEMTQMKGDGEAHPLLSPEDEFADFETWDSGSFGAQPKTPDMLPREYAREGLKRGLNYEVELDANPFKFGMIGSSDSHTGLATIEEDNFFGKAALVEPTADPIRYEEVIAGRLGPDETKQYASQTAASGLAAVWARENTREAIWDAMARKEVFATTGTRIRVRVFGGYGFTAEDLDRADFAKHGYEAGVPMGGDLSASDTAPSFLIRVLRDPDGANLDRVQIIKGWADAAGDLHERIYDVAVSDGREINASGRATAPVGNTVNVAEASYSNSIGAGFLDGFWSDPEFDTAQRTFYYVRVIEIPTPRWTTYDARFFGTALPDGLPTSIQERAYTSPIWYTPG